MASHTCVHENVFLFIFAVSFLVSPSADAAADLPRPLDRRLKVVHLGTTPLGSLGSTPTPPPGSTLGGCTGSTPTPPPGSTLRGSGGSTLRWSGGSTARPDGVGGHFGTTLASTSGFTSAEVVLQVALRVHGLCSFELVVDSWQLVEVGQETFVEIVVSANYHLPTTSYQLPVGGCR